MGIAKQHIIRFGVMLVVVFSVLVTVYHFNDQPPPQEANINMVDRNIDTPAKMLLNGFLGEFFRFAYLGNLNWLLLPLSIWVVRTRKRRQKWELAFLFFYTLCIFLIGIKGFFNFRYMMTLFPVTLGFSCYYSWQYLTENGLEKLRNVAFVIMGLMVIGNSVKSIKQNPFKHHYLVEAETAKTKNDPVVVGTWTGRMEWLSNLTWEQIKRGIQTADVGKELAELKQEVRSSFIYTSTPDTLLWAIDSLELEPGKKILVNNLPIIYYKTDKPAVYYWAGDDLYYDQNGKHHLFENRTEEQVREYITDSLNCSYFFTYYRYNVYDLRLVNFLHNQAEIVRSNSNGFAVYRIRGKQNTFEYPKSS